ncbi:MAG: HEAT repeat domain-containing protein [Planctomycetota bacterium]
MMSTRRLTLIHGKILSRVFAAALSATLVFGAYGQDRLPPSFPANPSTWNSDEREQAGLFVDAQVNRLLTGEESAISKGRSSLVEALTFPGGADQYISQLSEVIADRLGPLMETQDLMIRVNAIIVCTYLKHPDALAPIEAGLKDPNAGVRYNAANAMANLLADGQLSNNERNAALQTLENLAADEQDTFVMQPMLDALDQTRDDVLVLRVLNDRVAWHVGKPAESYEAERETLQKVYIRITTNPSPDPSLINELARVSVRYMRLASQQLADGAVAADRNRSHIDIVDLAATALRAAHTERAAPGRPPENPGRLGAQGNWAGVAGIAGEWVEVLKAPPFGFADADLSVEP